MQTSGIQLNKKELMCWLHHMGSIVTGLILAGCFAAIAYLKDRFKLGRTCINFHILTAVFSQLSCKPVVLEIQVLMFGLSHMGCIVTVCILLGCFVAIAYLKINSCVDGTSLH